MAQSGCRRPLGRWRRANRVAQAEGHHSAVLLHGPHHEHQRAGVARDRCRRPARPHAADAKRCEGVRPARKVSEAPAAAGERPPEGQQKVVLQPVSPRSLPLSLSAWGRAVVPLLGSGACAASGSQRPDFQAVGRSVAVRPNRDVALRAVLAVESVAQAVEARRVGTGDVPAVERRSRLGTTAAGQPGAHRVVASVGRRGPAAEMATSSRAR